NTDALENEDEINREIALALKDIGIFLANETNPERKAEIEEIFQEEHDDRLERIDALLNAFRNYQHTPAE
ncbi:MAG TPA: hypothetical protein VFL47_11725, partial [Flavisolibacter sp.]|nr:hypothetical protein [Flavisolibacter sp.]